VLADGNIRNVFLSRTSAVEFIGNEWPTAEQLDDNTWHDNATGVIIVIEEWELLR
jgi:hypothetical protein